MELTAVASSGDVMLTNAAVSPTGRLFGNFPRWTAVPTPSVGEATADGRFEPFPGGDWNEWRPGLPPQQRFVCTHGLHADLSALTEDGVLTLGPDRQLRTLIRDERISGPNEGSLGPDGHYYFPNSQAPRVNRPYEVFKVTRP